VDTRHNAIVAPAHRLVHAIALLVDHATGGALNQAEALVLWHLHASGSATMTDLHRVFGHRRSTLTSVVDRLESRNLVRRKSDPQDRRSFIVSLTPSGRKAAQPVVDAFGALEAGASAEFGAAPARKAHDLLEHLIAAAEGRAR
jgi:DNA-binding MarR family transcriptional regulator